MSLPKLVRDKIPQIIEDEPNKTCDWYVADLKEYKARLYEKMREELDEFIAEPCFEEAADMYEVLCSICDMHNMNMSQVEYAALIKRKQRGGLKDRIILEKICQ